MSNTNQYTPLHTNFKVTTVGHDLFKGHPWHNPHKGPDEFDIEPKEVPCTITEVARAFNATIIISVYDETAIVIMGTGGHGERYALAVQGPDDGVGANDFINELSRAETRSKVGYYLRKWHICEEDVIKITKKVFGDD